MKYLAYLIAAAISASAYAAQPAPANTSDGVLVSANGMSLYTFDKDEAGSGKSVCNGPCAAKWPPLIAGADAVSTVDGWTVITRDDGSRQWAFKGKPVYFWAGDQKPGDRNGDGVNGVWRIARP